MRVGLDFDNTLARYDSVFASIAKKEELVNEEWNGTKQELKSIIQTIEEGDKIWQKIQGQVYGPSMQMAEMFPGIALFLLRCKFQNANVFIVSHKTKYGHFDETKTPLRQAALKWMEGHGFFDKDEFSIPKENVFFTATRKEKVEKIESLDLDVFVDDLEEVFGEDGFPKIKKILFSKEAKNRHHDCVYSNWSDISKSIIGEFSDAEVKNIASIICKIKIKEVEKLKGRGNSLLYKIRDNNNCEFILKLYPDLFSDNRERMITEVSAYNLVKKFNQTPQVIAFNKALNAAVYEWVNGGHLSSINDDHMKQALDLIKNIKTLTVHEKYSLASESCLSIADIISQIEKRYNCLLELKNKQLINFLNETFKPLLDDAIKWSKAQWLNYNLLVYLPINQQVLSPSDFGFHNAILKKNGQVCFIDFEYFGRDDPVKLISDFVWHPGMSLSMKHKKKWLNDTFEIFHEDDSIIYRFKSTWALYGLRWVMIILNEFHKDGWGKRVYADNSLKKNRGNRLNEQLKKASDICENIHENDLECPYV